MVAAAIWFQASVLQGHQLFSFYFARTSSLIAGILYSTTLKFFIPAFYKESTLLRFGLLVVIMIGCVLFGALQAIMISIITLLGWIGFAYGFRQTVHGVPMIQRSKPDSNGPTRR